MSNIIYSTVDTGRTHIALGEHYLGNVNTYNNDFTRFFAQLFGKAMVVDFGDKQRVVNTKSYIKLLNQLGNNGVTDKTVKNLGPFQTLQLVVPQYNGSMRHHLSPHKVHKLTVKLINAINKDPSMAFRQVGKGADINCKYWDRKGHPSITFDSSFQEGILLRKNEPARIEASSWNPVLQAAYCDQADLVAFMKKVGGNADVKGQSIDFRRARDENVLTWETTEEYWDDIFSGAFLVARIPMERKRTFKDWTYREKTCQMGESSINSSNQYQYKEFSPPTVLEEHSWKVTKQVSVDEYRV